MLALASRRGCRGSKLRQLLAGCCKRVATTSLSPAIVTCEHPGVCTYESWSKLNSLHGGYTGAIWDPHCRATRLCIRSFDHGSYDFLVQEQWNTPYFGGQGRECSLSWLCFGMVVWYGDVGKQEKQCLFRGILCAPPTMSSSPAFDVPPSQRIQAETWTGQTGAQM